MLKSDKIGLGGDGGSKIVKNRRTSFMYVPLNKIRKAPIKPNQSMIKNMRKPNLMFENKTKSILDSSSRRNYIVFKNMRLKLPCRVKYVSEQAVFVIVRFLHVYQSLHMCCIEALYFLCPT